MDLESGSVSDAIGSWEGDRHTNCLVTRHVRAAMPAQRNKTDKADALGLAHLMRTGWFRKAHIKSERCYRLRLLLTHRRNL